MDKETLEAEAKRLHVDLSGLTWPQKQGAVMAAQKAEGTGSQSESGEDGGGSRELTADEIKVILFDQDVEDPFIPVIKQGDEVLIHVEECAKDGDPMAPLRGKQLLICPEMAQTTRQLFGYDELLDEEVTIEEVVFENGTPVTAQKDVTDGTYRITGKTGKRVVAHTALPKEGAGITFKPDEDIVPVVTFQGRSGYLWTHHRLPNVKQLLIESGYYEDYRERFKDEPWVWHAAGKLLCCDINLTKSVLRDIERKAREDRIRNKQTEDFIKSQMGE